MKTEKEIRDFIEETYKRSAKIVGSWMDCSPHDLYVMREVLKWVLGEKK